MLPIQQYVSYFVGAPIRAEAIVQKAMNDDPEYQEFRAFKRWREARNAANSEPQLPELPALPSGPEEPGAGESIIVQTCTKCHSGNTPRGGLLLDSLESIYAVDCETRLLAMQRVAEGSMPPKSALSADERGSLVAEFLSLTPKGVNKTTP